MSENCIYNIFIELNYVMMISHCSPTATRSRLLNWTPLAVRTRTIGIDDL